MLSPAPAPSAVPTLQHGRSDEDAEPAEVRPPIEPVPLFLPSVCFTLGSSAIACTFNGVGLFVLSLSERGFMLMPKTTWSVLLLPVLAWHCMYYIPISFVAMNNIRAFTFYGNPPSGTSLVCFGTSLGPKAVAEFAGARRLNRKRAFLGTLLVHCVHLVLGTVLLSVYLDENLQHFGLGMVYLLSGFAQKALDHTCMPFLIPDSLNELYAYRAAPAMFIYTVGGFWAIIPAYIELRHRTNVWVGLAMPLMISFYKMTGTAIITSVFTRKFVIHKAARRAFAHSEQGIVVSVAIAFVQAHGEALRLVWVIHSAMKADSDSSLEYLLPVVAGTFWNIVARAGLLDRLWDVATCGWQAPTRCRVLLHDTKACMSCPRFFAIFAILCARFCGLGNVLPSSQESLGWALLVMLAGQFVEDTCSLFIECAGLRIGRRPRQMFADDFERGSAVSVMPMDEVSRTMSVKEEYDRILAAFDFAYQKGVSYMELPFWAHFSVTAVVQFHTVLALIFFVSGLNVLLGLCDDVQYSGVGRALLWWPITDVDSLCEGG